MDKLESMMIRQKSFADMIGMGEDPEILTREYVLYIIGEAIEVLAETNWKRHRQIAKTVIRANVVEELIDIIKFTFGLACHWGITADELFNEFHRKSTIVENRYQEEHANAATTRLI